ncbi:MULTISPECIES: ABC transporter permease [Acidithrix]|nr:MULTISPECIES: ABC transporter permease [Acidithrix]CAG4901982.1 unnamed protein product [Acidithrix sp. C25]
MSDHPMVALLLRRGGIGIVTLVIVSIIVFAATEVLPGNAAYAVLGHTATPARLHAMEVQLHLNRSLVAQYWSWFSGMLTGHLGTSLANGQGVWQQVEPRLINSGVLVLLSGIIGVFLGMLLGAIAALRRDGWFDHVSSVILLGITSLPEFVVAIAMIILFATVVTHLFPAVSIIPPGTYAWSAPKLLVLPVLTLVIVIIPYIMRMTRGAMVEALESEYVQLARLEGIKSWKIVIVHALPNAIAPTIQVIGLTVLYLAGGIVIVEDIFNFPGVGQGLVSAVANRDIPVIQFMVFILAALYVIVNILTDVVALLATPRRRLVH